MVIHLLFSSHSYGMLPCFMIHQFLNLPFLILVANHTCSTQTLLIFMLNIMTLIHNILQSHIILQIKQPTTMIISNTNKHLTTLHCSAYISSHCISKFTPLSLHHLAKLHTQTNIPHNNLNM